MRLWKARGRDRKVRAVIQQWGGKQHSSKQQTAEQGNENRSAGQHVPSSTSPTAGPPSNSDCPNPAFLWSSFSDWPDFHVFLL